MKNKSRNNTKSGKYGNHKNTLLDRLRYSWIRELGVSDELAYNFNLIKKKIT